MASSYTLGDHFEAFIKEQIEGGRYASASEVVRDGLRLLEEDQQHRAAVLNRLRGEVDKGRRSGRPRLGSEILDRLERKYVRMGKGSRK